VVFQKFPSIAAALSASGGVAANMSRRTVREFLKHHTRPRLPDSAPANIITTMLRSIAPVTLALPNGRIRLEPLRPHHAEELLRTCGDPAVWTYAVDHPTDLPSMRRFIETAMAAEAAGRELPFAIVEPETGAVGSTRYLDIQREHAGVEVGWTFLGTRWQRTSCNTECKLLLFRHAFATLGAERVQLKADARNAASLRAMERIGAVREGTLRRHRILPDGFVRDSVYFSVIREEWPRVEARLTAMLPGMS
jgi:RimJ/RimL family protein N-acetyltransferase